MASHQSPPFPDITQCRALTNQLLLDGTDHNVARHLLAWSLLDEGREPADLFEELLRDTHSSVNVPMHANLGWMLTQCSRSRKALNRFSNDLDDDPENNDIRVFAGICLQRIRDYRTSARVLAEAVERDPGNLLARRYYANALMNAGRWSQGLFELEHARGTLTPLQDSYCRDISRLWMGQDLAGKDIVIVGNESPSDQILFSRYIGELRKLKTHKIGYVCEAEMIELMRFLPGVDRVDTRRFEPYDYFVPVESLPLRLGSDPSNIPAPIPYLHFNHHQADKKRARINGGRPLLGICWRNSRPEVRHEATLGYETKAASLELKQLEGTLKELGRDYDVVSFQEDLRPDEREILNDCGVRIIERGEFRDFAAIAEWISCLDLFFSVDSAIAHLAGALGINGHVLLPFVAEWKWSAVKGKSPWYPHLKIYEREFEDSWGAAVEEALGDLKFAEPLRMAS